MRFSRTFSCRHGVGAPVAGRLAAHPRVLLHFVVARVARAEAAFDALDDLLNAGR